MSTYILVSSVLAGLAVFSLFIVNLVRHYEIIEHSKRADRIRNGLDAMNKKEKLLKYLMEKTGIILGPQRYKQLKIKLTQAGMENTSPESITLLGFAAAVLMMFMGWIGADGNLLFAFIFACVGGFIGFMAVNVFISARVDRRKTELQSSILTVVEQFCIAVECGLTLPTAIITVSNLFENPLTLEFKRFEEETKKFGQKKAFESLKKRCGHVDDVRLFIEALQQSLHTGTSMKKTLRDQVVRIRTSMKIKATAEAGKLGIKMLMPSIIFQLPAFMLVLFVPAAINMIMAFKGIQY